MRIGVSRAERDLGFESRYPDHLDPQKTAHNICYGETSLPILTSFTIQWR